MSTLKAEVPRAFTPLLGAARYKAAYGGRGGAKSHFFAEQLVLRCYSEPTRAVCIREVQNSLKESVRQLVVDKIAKFGLGSFYEVLEGEVRGANGSLIIFRGMQSYNADTIKSLEGYDIAWVEEAQTLSAVSLRTLRPTIRKLGSEIWFSWNPRHDTDPVDAFFRDGKAPPRSIAVNVNWNDNPWFPAGLHEEMEHDYVDDPEMAEHVWGGGYEIITEGAYYARLIAKAESEGRVGFYPYDPDLPVKTAWDLGVDDYTAVWFLQENGKDVRAIDYYEVSNAGADLVIEEALPELLPDPVRREEQLKAIGRPAPYRYAMHYLPHDVKVREWGAGAKSRHQTLIELGMPAHSVHIGVATDPADRVNAVRRLLPHVQFNRNEQRGAGVNLGLSRLRKYRRRFNESLQTYVGPLHDENSHGSDALGEFAINCAIVQTVEPEPERDRPRDYMPRDEVATAGDWMTY